MKQGGICSTGGGSPRETWQTKKVDDVLKEGVKNFVEKIPKIESHYTRANTSKHFIDGSKSIADIHRLPNRL